MLNSIVSIYKYDGLKVMLVTSEHTLEEVLEAFENVLRGSGFYFDGHLEITKAGGQHEL